MIKDHIHSVVFVLADYFYVTPGRLRKAAGTAVAMMRDFFLLAVNSFSGGASWACVAFLGSRKTLELSANFRGWRSAPARGGGRTSGTQRDAEPHWREVADLWCELALRGSSCERPGNRFCYPGPA